MKSFFNAENWLWKPLGWLGDLVLLSLLWTVLALPLVTLVPASAALYDAVVHTLGRRDDALSRFFRTLRRELKGGALLSLYCAVLAFALWSLWRFALLPALAGRALLAAVSAYLLGFFLLCALCWVGPALSRFAMKPAALLAASVRLAFGYILRSAAMALVWGAALYAGVRFTAPFFVCPALAALLSSLLIEPVFRKYEPAEQSE